jgi:bilirubin oxidase
MLDAFNVTYLKELGYESAVDFADPMNPAFGPREYSEAAYEPAALSSAVASLASLAPYASYSSLAAAEASYYATAGYHGDATSVAQTTTVAASSSGYGFASSTVTGASTAATAVATQAPTAAFATNNPFAGHRAAFGGAPNFDFTPPGRGRPFFS